MGAAPLISICVPVYNRKNKLIKLLKSIDLFEDIEVIIVDDGSIDGLKNLLKEYIFDLKIKLYLNNKNLGRSPSLADSIKYSSGRYIIIMDSDDYFLPGALRKVKSKLKKHINIKSFLFGTKTLINGVLKVNLPPKNLEVNLLKLRADFKLRDNFKEVVSGYLLKKCIYKKAYQFRRTPTSLMWLCISSFCVSKTIDIPIIVKNYEKLGMTSVISKLKFENAEPMRDLYYKYSISELYSSDYFRIRSKIQFYRYSFISKKNFKIKITDIFFILIGYVLYFYDIINYKLIVK